MYKLSSFSCVFYFSSNVSVMLVQKSLFSSPLAEQQLLSLKNLFPFILVTPAVPLTYVVIFCLLNS